MTIIPEMDHVQKIRYLRFYASYNSLKMENVYKLRLTFWYKRFPS